MAGITISALTGSDSAPSKANEAKQKNDIGSAKDQLALLVHNVQMEAYDDIYVKGKNDVSLNNSARTVGERTVEAVLAQYGSAKQIGDATMIAEQSGQNAKITITTRDFTEEGTINIDGGTLSWKENKENTPKAAGLYKTDGTFISWEKLIEDDIISNYDGGINATYGEFDGELVIDGSVTSIDDYAFFRCTGLTNVTIPSSVTSMGEYAFNECTGLTSVTIQDGVTSIEDYEFFGCTGLTSVTIPNSVTRIGCMAFDECTGLTSIKIPSSVTSIGEWAFCSKSLISIEVASGNPIYDSRNNCNALIETETNKLMIGCRNTVIPNGVTSIEEWAFSECTGLTSITIPSSVTSIGYCAFSECTGLTSVTIQDGVTSIGDYAFSGCTGLTSIIVNKAENSITGSPWSAPNAIVTWTGE